MSTQAISVPFVIVNGNKIKIITGSLVYDDGEGEVTVRAVSSGGGGGDTVHTINAESKFSIVKFDLAVTTENDQLVKIWKNNVAANTVEFGQRFSDGTAVAKNYAGMSVVNRLERAASPDGVLSVEFQGDPAIG